MKQTLFNTKPQADIHIDYFLFGKFHI